MEYVNVEYVMWDVNVEYVNVEEYHFTVRGEHS